MSSSVKITSVFTAVVGVLMCLLETCAVSGKVKSDKDERGLDARSILDNHQLDRVIQGDEYIYGLTALESQLFVIRGVQIEVYDTKLWTLTRNITIPGLYGLSAIVASSWYNCLYISDNGRNHRYIYRYNLTDDVIINWSAGGSCFGLSLTDTHNVLVTLDKTRQIKEYTPNGSLVREISLESSMERPWHSLQLSDSRFVVCHGYASLNRVCIVDENGSVDQCYGGSKGSDVGQLDRPTSLAIDDQANILVTDWLNNRVVLLSSSLTHLGYIQSFNRPCAIHFDSFTRRLYIGEFYGRVFVLTV